MMILRHLITLQGRNWTSTIQLDSAAANPISPEQLTKLQQFGSVQVARGGTVTPASGAAVTLDAADVFLPADFPIRQVFSLDDYTNAASLATAWQTLMLSRIQAANITFMSQTATQAEGTTTITDEA
jgi:hypothetical protein